MIGQSSQWFLLFLLGAAKAPRLWHHQRAGALAPLHSRERVVDPVQPNAVRDQSTQVEPTVRGMIQQQRYVDQGIGRSVHAAGQRASEVEQFQRAEPALLVLAADTHHSRMATAPGRGPCGADGLGGSPTVEGMIGAAISSEPPDLPSHFAPRLP